MRSSSLSSSSSAKHQNNNNSTKSGDNPHFHTLHKRMCHALSLGLTKSQGLRGRRWQSADIEVQRHAVRSIEAFLDCISVKTARTPLVKDSMANIFGALVGILEQRSEAILNVAASVTVKLVSVLPNQFQQSHALDLLCPLSSLLLSRQTHGAMSCAIALSMILSNLSLKKEREVFEMLNKTDTIGHIRRCILEFSRRVLPVEYFHEMAALLSTIVCRWPFFRYRVWSDTELMNVLKVLRGKPDATVKVAVLKLYSAIALCGEAAKNLLEHDADVLQLMVHCMGSSYPHVVRVEGFRLAQCLVATEQEFSRILSFCCEPIVSAIICAMSQWNLPSGRVFGDEMSLLMEACRLALITRWEGEHHIHFWKQEIHRVLLYLLLDISHVKLLPQQSLSLENQIFLAREGLKASSFLSLRPYIFDILGYIAIHCEENFKPSLHRDEIYISVLISCACVVFVDSIGKVRQLGHDGSVTFGIESAAKAAVMMVFSPCKYIAAKTTVILSKLLAINGAECVEYLKHSMYILKSLPMRDSSGDLDTLQISISLMAISCYSALPQNYMCSTEHEAFATLLAFTKWCLSSPIHMRRVSANSQFFTLYGKTCCRVYPEDWEGTNSFLTLSLWVLAVLIHSSSVKNSIDISSLRLASSDAHLVDKLQEIVCSDTFAPGSRWYAAYILSYNGIFGFPTKLGSFIGKALKEDEYSDVQLNFSNGESVCVHAIVLIVRCPSLLPPEEPDFVLNLADASSVKTAVEKRCGRKRREVLLSAHVDQKAVVKLLRYIYSGYLQADEELEQKLRIIAKRCKMKQLLQLLNRRIPKWGTPLPVFDLTPALGSVGHRSSDTILEAKENEHLDWTCSGCSMLVPHMHVHKVVLVSSCDYLCALFRSGMQESHGQTIKAPVSWEALIKLVKWFYSGKLPGLKFGCSWSNMNTEERLNVLQPYLELCWLAEFWFLEEIKEACTSLIISSLESARFLSVRILQTAADLSLWNLAEAAVKYMAPLYTQLRASGDLEGLDDELVNMVRTTSVQLSHDVGGKA